MSRRSEEPADPAGGRPDASGPEAPDRPPEGEAPRPSVGTGPGGPLRLDAPRCRVCGGARPEDELDDYGWCPDCRERLERRIRIGKHLVALAVVLPFAVWILTLERGAFLPLWAWLLPLAAAYYLGLRIGREALKGYVRWRRVRGGSRR